jgi:hypothetical protein
VRREVGQAAYCLICDGHATRGSSVDRVREWAALIGRRDIAHVVFVSLLVPFGTLMEAAGPQVLIPAEGSWPR